MPCLGAGTTLHLTTRYAVLTIITVECDANTSIKCPSGETFIRNASQSLSSEETAWLQKRRPNVIQALETYLNTVGVQGLNVSEYVAALSASENAVPTIGLTWSGGGT